MLTNIGPEIFIHFVKCFAKTINFVLTKVN
jgi:hypothetical protein